MKNRIWMKMMIFREEEMTQTMEVEVEKLIRKARLQADPSPKRNL
jgi:hypothetical protein